MRVFLLLFVSSVCFLSAQIELVKEEVSGTRYILTFRNSGYPYTVAEKKGVREIRFDIPFDESAPGSFSLPQKELFIALPAGTSPRIDFKLITSSVISNVAPARAPQVQRLSDSAVQYSEASSAVFPLPEHSPLTFRGYLWIGNSYCAHLTVRPYTYRPALSDLQEATVFQVIVNVPSGLSNAAASNNTPVHPLVVNRSFATGWQAAPKYSVNGTGDWIDYGAEYLKIGVVRDGVYRLSYSTLEAYGVPVSTLNPKSIKLFLKGREIPLYVSSSGESDITFDPTDFIEFVGRKNYGDVRYRDIAPNGAAYYEYLNLYSDTTVYWLNWTGASGKRVDTVAAVAGAAIDTTRYYDELIHKETNYYFDFSYSVQVEREYPQIRNNKTWLDGTFGVGKLASPFTVSNLYTGRPARAFIKLQDFSSSISTNAHNLSLSINSNPAVYDSGFINKYQMKVLKGEFPSSVLVNGNNTVNLSSYTVPENTVNTIIRDWFELEYPRQLKATSDSLHFSYRNLAGKRISLILITGLTSQPVVLYKFNGKDSTATKITNIVRSNDTLKFVDSLAEGMHYFLIPVSKAAQPVIFNKKTFVNLRNQSNRADYLAITHPYFLSAAAVYTSFIASTYGVATKLINVEDIYDEFNYGFPGAEPVKDFLQTSAVLWQSPKPKTVLLIGKGTYDYYGNKNKLFGAPKIVNFVPSYGSPVSDTWFVIWDSTGAFIPQMSIGRIPAKSIEEFQGYYSKHQKYVTKGYDDWNKKYLFFSGGNFTDPNQIAKAKGVNDFVINNYVTPKPIGGSSANFYKTVSPTTNFGPYPPEYITSAIDDGGVFISYIGHSGTQTWDNSITDISQLANTRDRNPLITDFGCSTGKFAESDILSFSELAVNSLQGQAIGYIGNSSLGFESTAYTFPQLFYKKLLVDTSASMGDVHRLAKIDYLKQFGVSGTYGLFILTNTLIGDPIVRLPIPTKPNFTFSKAAINRSPENPSDQTDSVTIAIVYHNLGSVPADSFTVSVTDHYAGATAFTFRQKRMVPLFQDTIRCTIPVKGTSGEHIIVARLDSANGYSELNENDNTFEYKLLVTSSSIRTAAVSNTMLQSSGVIRFLNPSVSSPQTEFLTDFSLTPAFTQPVSVPVPYTPFFTDVTIDPAYRGKRIWIRPRVNASGSEGQTLSLFVGTKNNVLINDSITFSAVEKNTLKYQQQSVALDTAKTLLTVISAAFNDGNTAVIMRNGQNLVPENTIRAHHINLFDAVTFESKGYYKFDVSSGSATVSANYKTFLDTLSSNLLVAIAICSEGGGSNLTAALKTSIKSLGSVLIDSVKAGYYSWAIIGRKGAAPGSVPEKFSKPFQGRVQIDTTLIIPGTKGSFITQPIGPVAAWTTLETKHSIPSSGSISLGIVGVKKDNTADTLQKNIPIDTVIDISTVNASLYPAIKIFGAFTAGTGNASPTLSSIAVNYAMLPELGTNYQSFKGYHVVNNTAGNEIASTDTIVQGAKVQFTYRIYNAGGTTAKNVAFRLSSTWENNYVENITAATLDSIAPGSYREITTQYSTSLGSGRRTIQLSIDPDTAVNEIYKDNNLFSYPLVIKKSPGNPITPNLSITQSAVTSVPLQITDETDAARFTIVYSNTGSLANDSVSIRIRHYFQSDLLETYLVRRKYPVSYDTVRVNIPIRKNAGAHQLSVELDYTGLIGESSEGDNLSNYYFTVATTEFKVIAPLGTSIAYVDKIVFLNPTAGSGSSTITFQYDTLPGFSTARSLTKQMEQFATTFLLPGLKHAQRYFWRIKFAAGTNDWTTGSFYSGDSSVAAVGQMDSAAWKENRFTRTAYSADSGARIVDTRFTVKALSAGFNDGNIGSVEVNGVNIVTPILGSGHNVLVLDTVNYSVERLRRFDLAADATETDSLIQFIGAVQSGKTVIDIVVDEGSNNLTPAARNALKSIGSKYIDLLSFRDSWAIIGKKGAAAGTVPENYKPQNSGSASAETSIVRSERSGIIETPLIGPFSTLSDLRLNGTIPSGAHVTVQFVGVSAANGYDTLLSVTDQTSIPLHAINTLKYRNGKLVFRLASASSFRMRRSAVVTGSPIINSWTITASTPTELAVSSKTSTIDRSQVMEGEVIRFSGTVFNVSTANAESVLVQLKTVASGIDQILKQQRIAEIPAGDSASFVFDYTTRGKQGNHAFTFEIDPLDSLTEQSKANNSVTIPYVVTADTLRPAVQVTFDGMPVLNGDYVGRQPEIRIRLTDNNPSQVLPSDTSNFTIRLNNRSVPFIPGTAELLTTNSPGKSEVRWTPVLSSGENIIRIFAKDISGNYSDTVMLYVNVAADFHILDIFNLPNPFTVGTQFTFTLAGPVTPDEVIIKIYTVAGRLIQEITTQGNIGFNKIAWDGRDKDGDEIGNGVYLYKVIVKQGSKQTEGLSKLVKMR